MRSQDKGKRILDAHSGWSAAQLSFVIVKDISVEGAFDDAVVSSPPFDAVIHAASPFHFNTDNPKRDLLDPAIRGTTGLLQSIKSNAPSVRNVVLTSSMAAVLNTKTHPKIYTEEHWNPVTVAEAEESVGSGYMGSKTFAEKAAWEFVENEKPNFTLVAINPPLIFGPVVHYLSDLNTLNTSNTIFRDIIEGKMAQGLPPTGGFPDWVDVRDVASAHVRAMETPEAQGRRFVLAAGKYSNADIACVIRDSFPDLKDKLPASTKNDVPADGYRVDNSRSKKILKLEYRPFNQCVVDTVKSLLSVLGQK